MSGIYLPNMEMPKSCYKCPMKRRDGLDIVCPVAHERFSVADVNILDYRLDNCPLIPVPNHGRLIDADALRQDWLENGENEYVYDTNSFLASLDDAPTIIPAEEEGT